MNYKIENEVIDKIIDGVEGEETAVYRVYEDGTKKFACSYWKPKKTEEPTEPEPTQLDRIEEQLSALAADSVTVANVETAILEGVNEV